VKIKPPSVSNSIGYVCFWIVLIIFWFATLGQRALIHPDEGRYAELSLGMLQSGDWITPRLNGILYFEKPALQYWMGALSFLTFGINEFAARFWPGLTGLLSVLAVGLTARRLWGNGHYAALVMAGSFWVIANSHFLTLDAGVTFFLTLTLCAFLWAQQDSASTRERRYGMWVAWAAMAGATLSKGLIGLLIPGCALMLYSLINWHWAVWRRMQWLPGMAIFLLLAAPWFWLVSERNPGFAYFFFVHEHFDRFLTTAHHRPGPLWYYAPLLFVGFLPWSSLLPRLVREAWPRRQGPVFQAERFLLIWATFVFVFFSLSSSKLPSYILPMFPALALLLGQTLAQAKAAELKRHLWIPVAVWGLITCAYPFVGYFASPESPLPVMQHMAIYLAAGGAGFLLCATLAWRFLSQGNSLQAIMLLTAGSLGGISIGSIGHDAYGQLKSSKAVVEQVSPYLTPDMEIFTVRNAYDQTFPFYLQRLVIQVDNRDEFEFGQKAEPGKAIQTVAEFVARWRSLPHAMAMLDKHVFNELQQQGEAMKPVYEDARRIVVIKP
jgi:4-amino-4-deoxy-L-arabinose transferase-like glycosyltransferase